MLVSNLYDIGLYYGKNTGCTRLFRNPSYWWLNQAIWFAQRGITDVFWTFPFLYLMWTPKTNPYEDQI
jgi:hypothetical protein